MRINLIGGPGVGKSATAGRVFSQMKEKHYSVEYVNEYVKAWVQAGRNIKKFDQIYIFGKQTQYEYKWLANGVKNIITDSPTFLSVFYANRYVSERMGAAIWELCKLYDEEHPFFNIFLERDLSLPYDENGRYQTKEEAIAMDEDMWQELLAHYPAELCCRIRVTNQEAMLNKILEVSIK